MADIRWRAWGRRKRTGQYVATSSAFEVSQISQPKNHFFHHLRHTEDYIAGLTLFPSNPLRDKVT
ncbi:hypothetical protein EAF00_011077 [Botryotinia globosa]|nr:hypothetical protein EAF00_011077 [Botryotinia globosa]